MLTEERKTAIMEILIHHRGKASAINAKEIAAQLHIPDNATYGSTRKLIQKVMAEYELPIGATKNGFFIMQTKKELDDEIAKLNKRIVGIKEHSEKVKAIYKQFHDGKQTLLVHEK